MVWMINLQCQFASRAVLRSHRIGIFRANAMCRSCALLLVVCCQVVAVAQQPAATPEATSASAAPTAATQWQPIVVPESTEADALLKFINEISKRQPATREQYIEMQSAIKNASEVALKHLPDRTSEAAKSLESAYLNSSVLLMGNAGKEAQQETMKRFVEYLKQKQEPTDDDLKMTLLACQNLEQVADSKIAINAYKQFADVLIDKKSDRYNTFAEMLKGNVQRLESIGKQLDLKAKLIDGSDFDLESTRGKIVLLYFWATWDQITEVEINYLKQVYETYHEKGFEIVSVSFDTDETKLKDFIKDKQIAWPVVWEAGDEWTPKTVSKFGISAIPTPILLDKEGKVTHLEARGLILGKLLSDIFNPASK
jgi:peroxiredoxin